MTGDAPFFLIGALLLLVLVPFFIIRDLKNDKKPVEIFKSNIMLIVLFFVSVGEVLRSILSADAMKSFNQALFLFIILFVVTPLVVLIGYYWKADMKKYKDPTEYKYYWVYKIRHLLFVALVLVFFGALYRFYLIYEIVFT